MKIKRPELEALIQKRMQSGVFHDVDELLTEAIHALDEKRPATATSPKPRKRLIDVLMSPAFAGSELKTERIKEYPEPPVRL